MKRKTKRFNGESESVVKDFASTGPDVEDLKKGMFAGAPSSEPEVRSFSTTGPEEPKPRAAKPKVKTGSGASGFGLNPREKDLQSASEVMKGGRAGERPTQRMTNAPLDKLKADRKAAAFNAERKAAAEERKKTARSTTSAVPYDSVNPNQYKMFEKDSYKKGGSASSRADGCAIRGKTRA
jgi:hypothetical protein